MAVCGLAAGSGASTLAWLIARGATPPGAAPMLLCELDGAAGGLCGIAGRSSERSLGELASGVSGGGLPFLTLDDGLRLIATQACRVDLDEHEAGLTDVLRAARRSHTTTIVDCGNTQTHGAAVPLALASHVIWVLPAGPRAAETVEAILLDGDLDFAPGAAGELAAVVARDDIPARADLALRDAVAERCDRLVLVPTVKLPNPSAALDRGTALSSALAAILEFSGLGATGSGSG